MAKIRECSLVWLSLLFLLFLIAKNSLLLQFFVGKSYLSFKLQFITIWKYTTPKTNLLNGHYQKNLNSQRECKMVILGKLFIILFVRYCTIYLFIFVKGIVIQKYTGWGISVLLKGVIGLTFKCNKFLNRHLRF